MATSPSTSTHLCGFNAASAGTCRKRDSARPPLRRQETLVLRRALRRCGRAGNTAAGYRVWSVTVRLANWMVGLGRGRSRSATRFRFTPILGDPGARRDPAMKDAIHPEYVVTEVTCS